MRVCNVVKCFACSSSTFRGFLNKKLLVSRLVQIAFGLVDHHVPRTGVTTGDTRLPDVVELGFDGLEVDLAVLTQLAEAVQQLGSCFAW